MARHGIDTSVFTDDTGSRRRWVALTIRGGVAVLALGASAVAASIFGHVTLPGLEEPLHLPRTNHGPSSTDRSEVHRDVTEPATKPAAGPTGGPTSAPTESAARRTPSAAEPTATTPAATPTEKATGKPTAKPTKAATPSRKPTEPPGRGQQSDPDA